MLYAALAGNDAFTFLERKPTPSYVLVPFLQNIIVFKSVLTKNTHSQNFLTAITGECVTWRLNSDLAV